MVLMVMWLSVELLSEFVELLVIEAQSSEVRDKVIEGDTPAEEGTSTP